MGHQEAVCLSGEGQREWVGGDQGRRMGGGGGTLTLCMMDARTARVEH